MLRCTGNDLADGFGGFAGALGEVRDRFLRKDVARPQLAPCFAQIEQGDENLPPAFVLKQCRAGSRFVAGPVERDW